MGELGGCVRGGGRCWRGCGGLGGKDGGGGGGGGFQEGVALACVWMVDKSVPKPWLVSICGVYTLDY